MRGTTQGTIFYNAYTYSIVYGETPLHMAAIKGHLEIVKFLSENLNRDINPANNEGDTPVHCIMLLDGDI